MAIWWKTGGVCGLLIAEKLGVEHAGDPERAYACVDRSRSWCAKRIPKQWTMYKRDEDAIASVKRVIQDKV